LRPVNMFVAGRPLLRANQGNKLANHGRPGLGKLRPVESFRKLKKLHYMFICINHAVCMFYCLESIGQFETCCPLIFCGPLQRPSLRSFPQQLAGNWHCET